MLVYCLLLMKPIQTKENECFLPEGCSLFSESDLSIKLRVFGFTFIDCLLDEFTIEYKYETFNKSSNSCKIRRENLYIIISKKFLTR